MEQIANKKIFVKGLPNIKTNTSKQELFEKRNI